MSAPAAPQCALDNGRGLSYPCPTHGYVHGQLEPRPTCDGCGAAGLTVLVGTTFGAMYCRACRRTGGPAWEPTGGSLPATAEKPALCNARNLPVTDGERARNRVSPDKRQENGRLP